MGVLLKVQVIILYVFWGLLSVQSLAGNLLNVALNKTASQRTIETNAQFTPAIVVDGNTGQDSCTATQHEMYPYWMVNLGDVYLIDHIKIYNVLGVNANRTHNLKTQVSSADSGPFSEMCLVNEQIPDVYTCTPDEPVDVKRVKLVIMTTEILNICEVEVMAVIEKDAFVPKSGKGSGTVLQTRSVVSVVQCAWYCFSYAGCFSFNVATNPTGKTCEMLGSLEYMPSNEDVMFWVAKY